MAAVEVRLLYRGEVCDGDDLRLLAVRVLSEAAFQAAQGAANGQLWPSMWNTVADPSGSWVVEVAGD